MLNIMTKWLFVVKACMVTSVCTEDVDCTDNAHQIFWWKNEECLLFTMGWSGRLHIDVKSNEQHQWVIPVLSYNDSYVH
jgi:hypothetical protein